MKSRRKADRAPKSEPVSDDEWLTQYGNRIRPIGGRAFKNRPPYPDQVNALSLTLGRLSVAEATEAIRTSTNRPSAGQWRTVYDRGQAATRRVLTAPYRQ